MATVILKRGRERSVLRRHPWVFSGAIERVEGDPPPGAGDTVRLCDAQGDVLGSGAWSPASQIRVRMWSFRPEEDVGPAFLRARVEEAVARRRTLLDAGSPCRLVNAESDGLPGLVADAYGPWLVCEFLSAGARRWRSELAEALAAAVPCRGVYERSDDEILAREGLDVRCGVIRGEAPPSPLEIGDGGLRFLVDVLRGHKTGFYLDQRENRRWVEKEARGREVLDVFAYTGAFSAFALRGGAVRVTQVESSGVWLEMSGRNLERNGLDRARVESVEGDAFYVLRRFRDARRSFDMVILDPPKFADSRGHLERACRGYKDVNLLAFKLLRPGGLLFTFSCSGLVEPALFQKVVADAALDAGRDVQVVRRLFQAEDHPTLMSFPEGTYLKGLVCRVR